MSMIRSKWTLQERIVHNFLKSAHIKHKMHPQIPGSPDITIADPKTAVFLNGCFWHGCSKHYKEPKTNKKYWRKKIKYNIERDKENIYILKKNGWNVIIIWEHDVKNGKFKRKLMV